jgi:hypothetical protein
VRERIVSSSLSFPSPAHRVEGEEEVGVGVSLEGSLEKKHQGGVVLISADGFCAFHLAGVVGQLSVISRGFV